MYWQAAQGRLRRMFVQTKLNEHSFKLCHIEDAAKRVGVLCSTRQMRKITFIKLK